MNISSAPFPLSSPMGLQLHILLEFFTVSHILSVIQCSMFSVIFFFLSLTCFSPPVLSLDMYNRLLNPFIALLLLVFSY